MKPSLEEYRKQWPSVGAVFGMAVGGATALAAPRMKKTQVLTAANLIALIVHQYEEYQDPGYGPTQINQVANRALSHLRPSLASDNPRNYPVNTHSGMCVNTAIAYPVYMAPILFPKSKTLGMMPVFFGMTQAALHGIAPKAVLGEWYGPGFLSSAMLHVPIGLAYLAALREEQGPLTRSDYIKGIAAAGALFILGLITPGALMADKNSPHGFTDAQMPPSDAPVDETAPAT
jgi:Protein of unknown function with HXXEE motif